MPRSKQHNTTVVALSVVAFSKYNWQLCVFRCLHSSYVYAKQKRGCVRGLSSIRGVHFNAPALLIAHDY